MEWNPVNYRAGGVLWESSFPAAGFWDPDMDEESWQKLKAAKTTFTPDQLLAYGSDYIFTISLRLDGSFITGNTLATNDPYKDGFTTIIRSVDLADLQGGGEWDRQWYRHSSHLDMGFTAEFVPDTVTPEPVSMVLLGTGLAGVAGAARRRRRKERL
jgi:hypothetical protein